SRKPPAGKIRISPRGPLDWPAPTPSPCETTTTARRGLKVAPPSMSKNILTQIFGSRNDRLLKSYRKVVERINALEPQFEQLSDAQLRGKTDEFRGRVAQGEALDDLLPEAFAVVREASKRTMRMRHFDVQLMGGIALHQ